MTVRSSIDHARLLEEQLAQASPDLLRELLQTFINTLLSAEADAVCGAENGATSPDRVNRRNGYRHRDFDTRAGSIDVGSVGRGGSGDVGVLASELPDAVHAVDGTRPAAQHGDLNAPGACLDSGISGGCHAYGSRNETADEQARRLRGERTRVVEDLDVVVAERHGGADDSLAGCVERHQQCAVGPANLPQTLRGGAKLTSGQRRVGSLRVECLPEQFMRHEVSI